MFPNSKQDEDIGDEEHKERTKTDKPVVDQNYEPQSGGICAGQSKQLGKVTVKAVQYIRATEW